MLCKFLKVEVGGAVVVVVRVPGFSPDRPFRASSRYFVRDGTISREAAPAELIRLIQSTPDVHFDEQPVSDATRDDLDPEAIKGFLAAAYPGVPVDLTERYLAALHALDPGGVPTVAGILLFGRDPQRFLLDAYTTAIRRGRWEGEAVTFSVRGNRRLFRGPAERGESHRQGGRTGRRETHILIFSPPRPPALPVFLLFSTWLTDARSVGARCALPRSILWAREPAAPL